MTVQTEIKMIDLPYSKNALAPHISEKTVDHHYNKHHKAYLNNLNSLIKDSKFQNKDLKTIIRKPMIIHCIYKYLIMQHRFSIMIFIGNHCSHTVMIRQVPKWLI